jgi:hypothetical protein
VASGETPFDWPENRKRGVMDKINGFLADKLSNGQN